MIVRMYRLVAARLLATLPAPAWEARLRGTMDGSELIPTETDTCPPPWIFERLHRSRRHAGRAAAAWHRNERDLRARLGAVRLRLAHAVTLAARAEQTEARARTRLDDVHSKAEALHESLNPPGHSYWSTRAYALGLGALTVLDLPLVYMAFQTFGLDTVQTLLLSALVSGLISGLCHFAGGLYRRMQTSVRVLWWVVLGTIAVFVVSLSTLRESALEVLRSTDDQVQLNPQSSANALLVISCASLLVAFLLAGHHRLEPMAGEVRRARREWKRAQAAALAARKRILHLQVADGQGQSRMQALQHAARERIASIDAAALQWMAVYAGANLLARDARELPPSLRQENLPRIPLPPSLAEPERTDSL